MSHFIDILENYKRIDENINNARLKFGRNDKVSIMAVTKTVPVDRINYAISLGIELIGENRVQEFLEKEDEYDKNCEIHFIGGLQNNKVKYIIDKVKIIESADSYKLIDEISRQAQKKSCDIGILLEVNIAGEVTKNGIPPREIKSYLEYADQLPGVDVKGLMTIPPFALDGKNDLYFYNMQQLYLEHKDKYNLDILSMGLSADYENAIKYGSNIVRIGTALFGNR